MFANLRRLLQPAPAQDWQPLVRSAREERRHAAWVSGEVYRNWLGPYYKAYHYQKAELRCAQGLRVQLIQEEAREGAVLFYDPSIGPGNFRHLFDYLAEQVATLGYHASTSDQRTRRHPTYTESILKHFLKPHPHDCSSTGRCQQRYGAVTVDLVLINGQPGFIRLFSNPFQDAIFTAPQPFGELLEKIFHQPPANELMQQRVAEFYKR